MSSPLTDPLLRPLDVERADEESDEEAAAFPPSPPISSSPATREKALFGSDVEADEHDSDPWGATISRAVPAMPAPLPPPVEADFSPPPKPVARAPAVPRSQHVYGRLGDDGDPMNLAPVEVVEAEAAVPQVWPEGAGG